MNLAYFIIRTIGNNHHAVHNDDDDGVMIDVTIVIGFKQLYSK